MATESKEDTERASQPEVQPNAVTVAVLRANGLPGQKNYFVRVNVGAMVIQTEANNEDSQNPVFNAQYTVPQSNERVNVWFEVFEKGWLQNVSVGKNTQYTLKSLDIKDGKVKTMDIELQDKDKKRCGSLRFAICWRKEAKTQFRQNQGKGGKKTKVDTAVTIVDTNADFLDQVEKERKSGGNEMTSKNSVELAKLKAQMDVQNQQRRIEAEKAKEAERIAEAKRIAAIKVVRGEYQVQVHIVEVRDLKPEDMNGTCDPICHIECFGQKKYTAQKTQQNSCMFDDVFFFQKRDMQPYELEEATLRVAIYDADTYTRDDLIGSVQFDLQSIYFRKNHEMYLQWVAVTDDENPLDKGVQGYLQLSITVLGPNDKAVHHDREAELRAEMLKTAQDGLADQHRTPQSLVILPPTIQAKLEFLVVTVWYAEELPDMDGGGIFMNAKGIDAYVSVRFAGNPSCNTRVETRRINSKTDKLSPAWNEELWMPVLTPTSTNKITISVWDRDAMSPSDDLVAHVYRDFLRDAPVREIGKGLLEDGSPDPKWAGHTEWLNLYGAAMAAEDNLVTENTRHMNTFPASATTYRGRVLVSFRRETNNPDPTFHPEHIHVRSVPGEVERMLPKNQEYTFKAYIAAGTELPDEGSFGKFRLCFTIDCGSFFHFQTKSILFQGKPGETEFADFLDSNHGQPFQERIQMPENVEFLPDIIVHLNRVSDSGVLSPICYRRYAAKDLLEEGFDDSNWPRWEIMYRDKSIDAIGKTEFPGVALMRLGLGPSEYADAAEADFASDLEAIRAPEPKQYRVLVNLIQARNLPPADDNGLIDPFIVIRFCGLKAKTEIKYKTRDPMYFSTHVFDVELPTLIDYCPDVILQVHDYDGIGSSEFVGQADVHLQGQSFCSVDDVENGSLKLKPKWVKIMTELGDRSEGEVLVSFQIIEKGKAFLPSPPNTKEGAPFWKYRKSTDKSTLVTYEMKPKFEDKYLEIITLGLKDVKPVDFFQVRRPFLEMSTGEVGERARVFSVELPDPTNENVNSGGRLPVNNRTLIPVKLPVDPMLTPRLLLLARDSRLGGFSKPVVGAASVCLEEMWKEKSGYTSRIEDGKDDNDDDDADFGMEFTIAKASKQSSTAFRANGASSGNAVGGAHKRSRKKRGMYKEDFDMSTFPGDVEEAQSLLGIEKKVAGGNDSDYDDDDDTVSFGAVSVDKQSSAATSGESKMDDNDDDNAFVEFGMEKRAGKEYRTRKRRDTAVELSPEDCPVEALGSGDQQKARPRFQLNDEDANDERPKWRRERDEIDYELEEDLDDQPFSNFAMYKGDNIQRNGLQNLLHSHYRRTATLKGVVNILDEEEVNDKERQHALNGVIIPKRFNVRCYILRARGLQPMDDNNRSDPYLVVRVGQEEFNLRESYIPKAETDVDFFQLFEFTVTLPGSPSLEIEIWDHDTLTYDDLIGATKIDLEDRWFSETWQSFEKKPIEWRGLYAPTSTCEQGQVEVLLDIFDAEGLRKNEPLDIAIPPRAEFEVRMIVWQTKNVTNMDYFTDQNDLFCRAWMDADDSNVQETDTHWRSKKGKGSFNWRMKFPLTYPCKNTYMHLQMWDRDLTKFNDMIAETTLDLRSALRYAHVMNDAVQLFNDQDSKDDSVDATKDRAAATKAGNAKVNGADKPVSTSATTTAANSATPAQEDAPLLGGDPGATEADKQGDAKELVLYVKNQLGLTKPPNAEWLHMTWFNHETGEREDRGDILISIEILPSDIANRFTNGLGRSEPNMHPRLPPPTGRFKFHMLWNPFYVMSECLGPALYGRCCACIGLILVTALSIFGLPYISALITIFNSLSTILASVPGLMYVIYALVGLCIAGTCGWCGYNYCHAVKLAVSNTEGGYDMDMDRSRAATTGVKDAANRV